MKTKIISIFIALICLPLLAMGQEVPEIGRIEVTTKDHEVETIEEVVVYEITETKTSWTIREINYYLDYHKGKILEVEKIIEQLETRKEKILEAIKGVKLKTQGESL